MQGTINILDFFKRSFFTTILIGFFLVGLTGCLDGNGEPYGYANGGGGETPTSVDTNSPGPKVYHWNVPDETCFDVDTGEEILTPRDRLRVNSDGSYTSLGNLCSEEAVEVDSTEVRRASTFPVLLYREGIYLEEGSIVSEVDVRAFCWTPPSSSIVTLEYLIYQSFSTGAFRLITRDISDGAIRSRSDTVVPSEEDDNTVYSGTQFSLSIEEALISETSFYRAGVAQYDLNGQPYEVLVTCQTLGGNDL